MEYIAIAIAPGIAICLFIFYKDIYNREPKLNLIVSFFLGCVAILPAVLFEQKFSYTNNGTVAGVAIFSYAVVAFSEEFSKFLGLRLYSYNKKSFDEPLDGIIYSVMVGMGFATLENLMYVLKYAEIGQGLEVGLKRMFLSVPAHGSFAVVMGYFVGKAKFDPKNSFLLMLAGLLAAVFFHGTFDFFLFVNEGTIWGRQTGEGLLAAGALVSFVIALLLSRKLIRQHRKISQQMFEIKITQRLLTIRNASVEDVQLIRELTFKVWPQTYASIISQQQIDYMLEMMYSETSLKKQMTEDGSKFILVYDNTEPVGFAAYQEIKPSTWKLHKIYILATQQGKGTGKFVMDHIIKEIQQLGAAALQLQVNRHNKARSFYEKIGFTVIEEADFDIGNGYFMNDFVMEKKL